MEGLPYGFLVMVALVVVGSGSILAAVKNGFEIKKAAVTIIMAGVFSVIGARLLYAVTNPEVYKSGENKVWEWGFHGFSLYGGIGLALISGWLVTRILRMDREKLADLMAPYVGVGVAIIRLGCFWHGCCFGKQTDLAWGVKFPYFSPAHWYQIKQAGGDIFAVRPVHPTQLYELMVAVIAGTAAWYGLKHRAPRGVAFFTFGLIFTAGRWFSHYLRQPMTKIDASAFYPGLYFLFLIIGIIGFKKSLRGKNVLHGYN